VLPRAPRFIGTVLCAWLAATVAGCGHKSLHLPVVVNQPPRLRLTQAPMGSSSPYFYSYEFFWTAFDPDGRVDHYLYAVDPPSRADADTPWVATVDTRKTLTFASGDADSLGNLTNPGGYHVFAIKAVDNQGALSPVVSVSFTSFTVAPTVQFIQPRANKIFPPIVPTSIQITWTGSDPDGQLHTKPLYYRYRRFAEDDPAFPFLTILVNPDSLRRFYAPTFAGWDSIAGDTCTVTLGELVAGKKYVFAVVAFDEAHAYSSVFSLDTNLLYFTSQYIATNGPQITAWNDYFRYTWLGGGFNSDPVNFVHVELPCGQPVVFQWSAIAHAGSALRRMRWSLDIADLDDETPRTNEATDFRHWSEWQGGLGGTGTAVLGTFAGGSPDHPELHRFYIEAEDDNTLLSLAVVEFTVVRPTFAKDLLFVDDTRYAVDQASRARPDSVVTPGGNWPSRAELDTFFFARGGVRWRNYVPVTTQSVPGVFKGYAYDTIGTRGLPAPLTLAKLAGYKAVVWSCDVSNDVLGGSNPFYYPVLPNAMLRYITQPGQNNVLLSYVRSGGKLWLMGGRAAVNAQWSYNVTSNDAGALVLTASAGELLAGTLMYSAAHWQTGMAASFAGRATANPSPPSWPGSPDYSLMPGRLVEKAGDGFEVPADPLPPERGATAFYQPYYDAEFLTLQNNVTDQPSGASGVLDTLYYAGDGDFSNPVMTYYHGSETGGVVFSGFPLWFFKRDEVIQLADFVLQDLWGLTRQPVSRSVGVAPASPAPRPAARGRTRS